MVTDGVRCASYLPTDGYLDPSRLTYALIDGARRGGARCSPTPACRRSSSATAGSAGVITQWGEIQAEIVVNAGGCSPPSSAGWRASGCR